MASLIRERGFEALTVQDIIDGADVGRSTFHTHFKSKEDLLAGSVEMMRSSLRKLQRQAIARSTKPDERVFAFTRELFTHAEQHREVFAAMVGRRSGMVFQQPLHRMLADLVREDLEARMGRKKLDAQEAEAAVQFVTGAIIGLLVTWMDRRTRLSAGQLDTLFHRMALPAVRALTD